MNLRIGVQAIPAEADGCPGGFHAGGKRHSEVPAGRQQVPSSGYVSLLHEGGVDGGTHTKNVFCWSDQSLLSGWGGGGVVCGVKRGTLVGHNNVSTCMFPSQLFCVDGC